MGLLFHEDSHPHPGPLKGFDRYRQILERDYMAFFLGGALTFLGFVPFLTGAALAVMSQSLLVMLGAGVIGGLFAGPFLYGMIDLLFRSFRDVTDTWFASWRKAVRENLKSALLPGVVTCLCLGIGIFLVMLVWWGAVELTLGSGLMCLCSALIVGMLLTVYWPQLVLFRQTNRQRLKNCILFSIQYFWHTLRSAALRLLWWTFLALLLPWSLFLLPVVGIWYILFVNLFLLYGDLDEAFQIEAQIFAEFPEQRPAPLDSDI